MALDLYKQAVRLIKIAEKKKRSPQLSFYSDSGNSGVAMVPRGVIDRTNDMPMTTPAQWISNLWQYEQSKQDMDLRSGNNNAAWKDIQVPYKEYHLNAPDKETVKSFNNLGLDFFNQDVQRLGNQPDRYFWSVTLGPAYNPREDEIIYPGYYADISRLVNPASPLDNLKSLAHETAHRRAQSSYAPTTPAANNIRNLGNHNYRPKSTQDPIPWRGAYSNEWPSVINEWTYGTNGGTISPIMERAANGVAIPYRLMTDNFATDPYYADMFPLVDMKDLKSEFGKIYSYWHGPNEPDIPSEGKKRLVYETPSGYWVDQFGNYGETGAQVFDPREINFSDNINKAQLPPNLQRIIDNLSFLNQGQPTDERQAASEEARQEFRDLMARVGLHREFFDSNGKTYAEMLNNTLAINDFLRSMGYSDEDLHKYWDDPNKAGWQGRLVMGVDGYNLADTEKALEEKPMWDPNMTLEPIPIGLAGLQKKYSVTPTVDEPSDWRDVRQYKAMIRDSQHCYDLQDEIDQYGPKDGGMGS